MIIAQSYHGASAVSGGGPTDETGEGVGVGNFACCNDMKGEVCMSGTILVGYATRSGSTKEIADVVGETLRRSPNEVDVQPLREVRSLGPYSSVVIGAPLYMFRWHKDAKSFLSRHRGPLAKLPVAVFALGPFHDEEKEWKEVRAQIDKELATFPWLSPVACAVFGGKFDPARLDFPWKLIPALKNMPASDIRDWDGIREWAGGLSPLLAAVHDGAGRA